ncbi:MAG TPA: ACT domain-containing protein [Solirubrobacterales bacterium]|jgi:glycine cleavage system transcriptional repressor|nr:ACT domain-containing protein [Solirubrobacterales bacterium]
MLKHYFAIQAIGKDRSGLVANLTGVVSERFGCNVENSMMTIIGGHFAATMIVSAPGSLNEGELSEALGEIDLGTPVKSVYISPLAEEDFRQVWRVASHEVTVEASERIGLLHQASAALAEAGVNITAASSSCSPDEGRCTVVLEVSLPGEMKSEDLTPILRDKLPDDILIVARPAFHNAF